MIEFAGASPDRQTCISQFELDADGRRLWVRLASSARFSVTIERLRGHFWRRARASAKRTTNTPKTMVRAASSTHMGATPSTADA